MAAQPLLTVAICTFNRREWAVRSLQSVLDQIGPETPAEVVVVDNNSTDGTGEACRTLIGERTDVARVVVEEKVGLSHARNRGYAEARGAHVAYLDDDAELCPGWIEAALKLIREQDPDLFGGPIFPFFDDDRPDWLTEDLAYSPTATGTRRLTGLETFSGPNMVYRKSLLERFGGFLPDFGMTAKQIGVGEETDLQIRMIVAGAAPSRWFSDALPVRHLFATFRAQPAYRIERARKEGIAYATILLSSGAAKRPALLLVSLAKWIVRVLQAFVALPFCRPLVRRRFVHGANVAKSAGMVLGCLRFRRPKRG